MNNVTIVMYHYIRDLKNSRYPDIKALDLALFREQIAYIEKHYNPVTAAEVMHAVKTGDKLPSKAALLTFDDAYSDHFMTAFPILDKAKIQGCFFPPAKCITHNEILDVNKIHFILASVPNPQELIEFINAALEIYADQYELSTAQDYWSRIAKPTRYDPAEIIYIKRMLQRELPEDLRNILTDEIFQKYVSSDQTAFSAELYMNVDQISHMQRNGMYVGSHGFDHYWLNSLSREKQEQEIDASLEFLELVGAPTDDWMMCYPYGGYNDDTLDILREKECRLGLTTHVGIADLDVHGPLVLPRLDTNDLPKDSSAAPSQWTIDA